MIQRIQSLYLFVVLVLSCIVLFTPVADIFNGGIVYIFNIKGITTIGVKSELVLNTLVLSVLATVIPLLALVALFMYKKRLLQMKLCVVNIVLIVGYYALLFFYLYMAVKTLGFDFHLHFAVIFPFISAVLLYLAIRAIGKDEALIRSLNRVR